MKHKSFLFALALFCGCFAALSFGAEAQAKTLTVVNSSGYNVKLRVIFRALGCAACYDGVCFSCKKTDSFTLNTGYSTSKSYSYPGGTSYKTGNLQCYTGSSWYIIENKKSLSATVTLSASTVTSCKKY